MKKLIFVVTILTGILFYSCSSDEESISPTFRFLEFEKDVLLPALNERDITFFAIDFDPNIGNWEITLSDGQKNIPVTLSQVETTRFGWVNTESNLQRIYIKAPAFGNGDYTLTIKNNTTNQIYSDTFLVRGDIFTNIEPTTITSYTIGDGTNKTPDYLYFQNTSNTITQGVTTNGIERVRLENATTFESFTLGHEVNTNGFLRFDIPLTIPVGTYFLSIVYNNGLSTYYEKDIVVMEQKLPKINAINKEMFVEGETLTITGEALRYFVNEELLPTNGLSTIRTRTDLIFKDQNRDFQFSFGAYEDDENFENINPDATELSFKIPLKSESFLFSDRDQTFFEGEVFIRSGPYESNSFPVRIDY